MMAISACFGSPMLSMFHLYNFFDLTFFFFTFIRTVHNVDFFLGIGLSGTYVTTKTGVPYKINVEPTWILFNFSLYNRYNYKCNNGIINARDRLRKKILLLVGVLCIFISIAYTLMLSIF